VNTTFYRLRENHVFQRGNRQTPETFRFVVKANRFITHRKRLADPAEHMTRFLPVDAALGSKLAAVLFSTATVLEIQPRRHRRPLRLSGQPIHHPRVAPRDRDSPSRPAL
jgi:uncharacterized protein YecE (DUF72 family)